MRKGTSCHTARSPPGAGCSLPELQDTYSGTLKYEHLQMPSRLWLQLLVRAYRVEKGRWRGETDEGEREGRSKRRDRGAANRKAHGTLGLASWVSREASGWQDPRGYIRGISASTWAISVQKTCGMFVVAPQ
ncbi:hypothetical protein V493_07887 [Pseudogymnoascus sp. VKM F-4281 (FW-2241)]|nr:hypothetical protein V493_07887 [Pseudogymnoascus sp. VKM F-4281 (FW-2241)]